MRAGYKLTSSFAEYDKKLSEKYFIQTEHLSEECPIDNYTHLGAFIESIRIMIRIYSGIVGKDKDYPIDKITNLINHIPSGIEQLMLWSELAIRVGLDENKKIAKNIVSKYIDPILQKYKSKNNSFYYYSAVSYAAPAIHITQPEALRLIIDQLPSQEKDPIISSVCYVALTKVPFTDPFHDIKGSSTFKYQEAIEFINLIGKIESDHLLYHYIKNLCQVGKNYPNNFTREQKTEIKRRLEAIIREKLPNIKTGVNHAGYKIASQACILHFNINNSQDKDEYEALEKEVLTISNTYDRAMVFSILAHECGIKKKKLEYINKAFDEADKIESTKEKIQLYQIILEELPTLNSDLFNLKVNNIQNEILKLDENEKFPTYRKLIDLAYKHNQQLAKRLLSAVDSDPGRKQLVEPVNEHFGQLELEKMVLNDYSQLGKIKNRKTLVNIVWRMLGELNSSKRLSRSTEQTIVLMQTASKLPFFYSVPLVDFFIQNYIKQNSSADSLLLSFYESSYSNAKLCYNLICNLANKKGHKLMYNDLGSEKTFVARPGMREQALEFIKSFLKGSGSKDIYIIDPYFSEGDMEFLKDLSNWCDKPDLSILTSCEAKNDFSKSVFINVWNSISSEEPPSAFFVRATNQEAKSPFHDRWIILLDKLKGIRIGTSINSLGGKKISEISTMQSIDVEAIQESVIIPLIKQRVKEFENQQTVKYETFEF